MALLLSLITPNTPKQSRSSNSGAAPSIDRSLRDRKTLAQPSTFASIETAEVYNPPPPEPLKFKKLEYAQLLPDGRKEYPRDLARVIEMIEEQCKEQEEAVTLHLIKGPSFVKARPSAMQKS